MPAPIEAQLAALETVKARLERKIAMPVDADSKQRAEIHLSGVNLEISRLKRLATSSEKPAAEKAEKPAPK